MSYIQPQWTGEKWQEKRRSKRLLHKRQVASGGYIDPKIRNPPNLNVYVQDLRITVPVYVNLETDVLKSAWCEARDLNGKIGGGYEMFYQ